MDRVCMGRVGYVPSLSWAEKSSYPLITPRWRKYWSPVITHFFFFFFLSSVTSKPHWPALANLGPINLGGEMRFMDFSRPGLFAGSPFATYYWSFRDPVFSHLFDPSRFATSVIFAVCRQLTVNYSLTTSCIQSTDFDKSVLF